MPQTESPWPLLTGLVIALLLHVVMIPTLSYWIQSSSGVTLQVAEKEANRQTHSARSKAPRPLARKPEPKQKQEIPLGKETAPDRLSMNWIGYDDFHKLLAQKAKYDQAAFQRDAQPVPKAPTPMDPGFKHPQKTKTPSPRPAAPRQPVPPGKPMPPSRQALAVKPTSPSPPPASTAMPTLMPMPVEPTFAQSKADRDDKLNERKAAQSSVPDHHLSTNQPKASAQKPHPGGTPVEQKQTRLPLPISTVKTPRGLTLTRNAPPGQTRARQASKGPVKKEAPAAQQPLAKTTEDQHGKPANQQAVMAMLPVPIPNEALSHLRPVQTATPTRAIPQKAPSKTQVHTFSPKQAKSQKKVTSAKPAASPVKPTHATPPHPASIPATSASATHRPFDRLTSAVADKRESSPFSIDHVKMKGKIGGVLVGKGIEILTRQPRFSAVTQVSAWPRYNPVVKITFAPDGVVLTCRLIQGSGFDGIDSPILTSCYFWKARGKRLKQLKHPFSRKFTFDLGAKTIH